MSFDKTGYQLSLFQCQSSCYLYSKRRLSRKWVCVKRHITFVKICMSFKVLQLTDWWKNIQQRMEEDHF